MMRSFRYSSFVWAAHYGWWVLEHGYRLHLRRENIVSIYILATFLFLNTNCVVLESKSDLAQSTNEFIGEMVGIDGEIVCVENGHDTCMVVGLSMSPVILVILANTVCQGCFIPVPI